VLPREVAMGKPGDYYVKGWNKKDQERIKERDLNKLQTKTERSEKSPQDYLNMDEGLTKTERSEKSPQDYLNMDEGLFDE